MPAIRQRPLLQANKAPWLLMPAMTPSSGLNAATAPRARAAAMLSATVTISSPCCKPVDSLQLLLRNAGDIGC